jgi:hypothetical protein
LLLVCHPQERFVHQRCGLKCVIAALAIETMGSQAAKLAVDEWYQFSFCLAISFAESNQQFGNFTSTRLHSGPPFGLNRSILTSEPAGTETSRTWLHS